MRMRWLPRQKAGERGRMMTNEIPNEVTSGGKTYRCEWCEESDIPGEHPEACVIATCPEHGGDTWHWPVNGVQEHQEDEEGEGEESLTYEDLLEMGSLIAPYRSPGKPAPWPHKEYEGTWQFHVWYPIWFVRRLAKHNPGLLFCVYDERSKLFRYDRAGQLRDAGNWSVEGDFSLDIPGQIIGCSECVLPQAAPEVKIDGFCVRCGKQIGERMTLKLTEYIPARIR